MGHCIVNPRSNRVAQSQSAFGFFVFSILMATAPHRYLATFFVTLIAVIGIVCSINYIGYFVFERMPNSNLLSDQLRKLEAAERPDLILLGDSALGNGVTAKELESGLGLATINLALTGSWGYGGALGLLQRFPQKDTLPKTVVFVFSIDAMSRPVNHQGLLLATPHRFTELVQNFNVIESAFALLFSWENAQEWTRNRLFRKAFKLDSDLDYIPQGETIADHPERILKRRKLGAGLSINESRLYYLRRIVTFCARQQIQCFYAHGPIEKTYLEENREFVERATRAIQSLGFRVVTETPIQLLSAQLGDTLDHVATSYKSVTTAQFGALLARQMKVPGH
jgi:hypothetical protein